MCSSATNPHPTRPIFTLAIAALPCGIWLISYVLKTGSHALAILNQRQMLTGDSILVGAGEQPSWHRQADRLGHLLIIQQFLFGCLLHRQLGCHNKRLWNVEIKTFTTLRSSPLPPRKLIPPSSLH